MFQELVRVAYTKYRVKLCVRFGDFSSQGNSDDLHISNVEHAVAVFFFTGSDPDEEGRRQILRLLTLRKRLTSSFSEEGRHPGSYGDLSHVYMEVGSVETKNHAKKLGSPSVICFPEGVSSPTAVTIM